MLPSDDPRVLALTQAVHAGDVEAVVVLLREHPELATDRHGDACQSRTALHIATDWPGNFPRVAETIAAFVAVGAPVDGRFAGPNMRSVEWGEPVWAEDGNMRLASCAWEIGRAHV